MPESPADPILSPMGQLADRAADVAAEPAADVAAEPAAQLSAGLPAGSPPDSPVDSPAEMPADELAASSAAAEPTLELALAAGAWEDPLTGVAGPALWRVVLEAESARCRRYGRTATVVLAEIGGLEGLARLWGADVATQAIVRAASILRKGSRSSDHVARIEPTRFAVLLTETDEVAAVNFVERVRERCDRQLGTADTAVRIAFGWASPTRSISLAMAAERAESRLRRELAGGD